MTVVPADSTPRAVDPRMPSSPSWTVPRGACDTHTHIFGPFDRYPFEVPASYPPPNAPLGCHRAMLTAIGVDRAVLVQPAPYGTDHRALLDALERGEDRARGVAVAGADITEGQLRLLHAAGVRGLRFNEMIDSGTGRRFAGSVGVDQLARLAPRARELGWHAQLWARCADVCRFARQFAAVGIPLVFEHMAGIDARHGVYDPAFQEVLALLADGVIWIKLSICRVARAASSTDYVEVRPFHDALVGANADRLLWASDWPFVRMGDSAPDVGLLLDLFHDWVPDAAVRQRILVDNPARLYGFSV